MARKGNKAAPPADEAGGNDSLLSAMQGITEDDHANWLVHQATRGEYADRHANAIEALDQIASLLVAGAPVPYPLALYFETAVNRMKEANATGSTIPADQFCRALALYRARNRQAKASTVSRLAFAFAYAARNGVTRKNLDIAALFDLSKRTADRAGSCPISETLSDDDLLHQVGEWRQQLVEFVALFK